MSDDKIGRITFGPEFTAARQPNLSETRTLTAGPYVDPTFRIRTLEAENERLTAALNPRFWTPAMSEAWHKNIPDLQAAFDALRDAAKVAHL